MYMISTFCNNIQQHYNACMYVCVTVYECMYALMVLTMNYIDSLYMCVCVWI